MLINIGRLLMLLIWTVLIYNFIIPLVKPVNYILNAAFAFMIIMHILKLFMFKLTLANEQGQLSKVAQLRLFLFGVFELLAWQKKWQSENKTSL